MLRPQLKHLSPLDCNVRGEILRLRAQDDRTSDRAPVEAGWVSHESAAVVRLDVAVGAVAGGEGGVAVGGRAVAGASGDDGREAVGG